MEKYTPVYVSAASICNLISEYTMQTKITGGMKLHTTLRTSEQVYYLSDIPGQICKQ